MGVLVAAVIFAGCGSDSSTNAAATDGASESTVSESSSGPLTKADFVKQANQICRSGTEEKEKAVLKVAKLATDSGKPPSTQTVENVVNGVILPLYEEIVDQLAGLEAPEADQAQVEKMVSAYQADLGKAEAEPIKATKENLFRDANDLAEAYGIESCHL